MKLARFDLNGVTIGDQAEKCTEEINEWIKLGTNSCIEADLEESVDVIQAIWGYLNKIATPEQIAAAFAAHEAKMLRYEKELLENGSYRVPKILGWVELKGVE